MSRRIVGALLATTALAVLSSEANAGAFASRQHSVVGAGMAYAGVAAPGMGLSGMFWNPAVVTSVEGRNSEWNVFAVVPQTRIENLTFFSASPNAGIAGLALATMTNRGGPAEIGTTLATTASYNNLQLNENVFVGLSINAPYGSGTNAGFSWGGAWDVARTRIFSLNFQPVVGYRFNDQFSIAVGAQIQYLNFTQEQALGPIGQNIPGYVTGDDWGYGFTLGLTWQPFRGTQLGIGYRSAVSHRLTGTQWLGNTVILPPATPVASGAYNIGASITLPQAVTFGLRQQVNDQLSLAFTAEWRNWARNGIVNIDGSPVGSRLVLNYRDEWFFSLGAEYRWDPQLTLRFGVGYERTPVQDAFRSLSIPDADRIWVGTGLSYQVNERLNLSGSYTFIHLASERLDRRNTYFIPGPNVPLTVGYNADTQAHIHIFGVSLRYQWDPGTPAPVTARF